MEDDNNERLTEGDMQRLKRLFEIFVEIDRRENVTGYFERNQDVRHNKNQHKQDSDYKAD